MLKLGRFSVTRDGTLIDHFRVPVGLCFKTRAGAQPLTWKSFFILMQIKLIFKRKVVHLALFWKWGFLELGSGLLSALCVIGSKLAAWGVIGHSSVMRDWLLHNAWRVIFLWNFRDFRHLKPEAETLNILDSYDTRFFLVSRPLISSDEIINRILVNVVNILFYFSEMRYSFKKIGLIGTPLTLPPCFTACYYIDLFLF